MKTFAKGVVWAMATVVLVGMLPSLAQGHWEKLNGPYDPYMADLVGDPTNHQITYTSTDGEGGVYKGTEGKDGWFESTKGIECNKIRDLHIDPSNTQIVYAAANDGISERIDGANTWVSKNDDLTFLDVKNVAIDSQNPSVVYAETEAEVFKGSVAPPDFNQVFIPNTVYKRFGFGHWDYEGEIYVSDACYPYRGISPGDFFEIPIVLEDFDPAYPIGGFELEVEFDYIDLTFYGVERGVLLSHRESIGDTTYSWEYLRHRVMPCSHCACCKYRILLYGQAEMPDGLVRRGYCLNPENDFPETYWAVDSAFYHHNEVADTVEVGATLVWLKFQVSNNELLRDQKLPIKFEWEHKLSDIPPYLIIQDWDCAENTMSSCDGVDLYVSDFRLQYEPAVCGAGEGILRILNFVDGGVYICSPCTASDCVRGDINLNHIAYETADAVLFARALIFGAASVFWNPDEQICATDVNADNVTMKLSDLIYLIRVILHDAVPFPKPGPSSEVVDVLVNVGESEIDVSTGSEVPIGAALFVFHHKGIVEKPKLVAKDMELLSNDENGELRVLVWSRKGRSIPSGEVDLFTLTRGEKVELASVELVDGDSRELKATISMKGVGAKPKEFVLFNNYPNPFNLQTQIRFDLPTDCKISLKIYNTAGQLVRTLIDQPMNAGRKTISWDGANQAGETVASGIYFYKLTANEFTSVKKMVLAK